jgi:serine/threonine-protein kinase
VWALGLIAFALLTGRSYWKCADQDVPIVAVLTEMFAEALVPASQRAVEFGLRCELPDGFDEWFAHCVARDAHERFKKPRRARSCHTLRRSSRRPRRRPW